MGLRRFFKLVGEMQRLNRAGPAEVAAVQERRLRALLQHAARRSPYYARAFRGLDLDRCQLSELPILTKQALIDHFDEIVTEPTLRRAEVRAWLRDRQNVNRLYQGRFIPFHTSGTTGENVLLVCEPALVDCLYATFIGRQALRDPPPSPLVSLKKLLHDLLIRRAPNAIILAADGPSLTLARHAPGFLKRLGDHRILSISEPLPRLVEQLNELQPEALTTYPSVIGMLAHEQLEGRLRISFNSPFSMLASLSEPLTDEVRTLAKQAWNKDVLDCYASGECPVIARSCKRYGEMHVMSDLCVLEVVDEQGRAVPDGEIGAKVLVTNLFNETQPIIRYEMSDVTGYSREGCDCGWPFPTLMRVEGRTDDLFRVSRPDGGHDTIHPYLFLAFASRFAQVRQYQIAQTGPTEITLSYVPAPGASGVEALVRSTMADALAHSGLQDRLQIKCLRVDSVPRDPKSGKFRQCVNYLR
jgi:phenylacetate-coenzyme A ligase PaaK-like adenylate-forming protein